MNRYEAERNYKQTLVALRIAEDISPAAYATAWEAHNISTSILVQAELKSPTSKESKKAREILRLRNIGLDI